MANNNITSFSSSSSSDNAMMMMMPPRKLLPPVESSFASMSTDGSNNNNYNNNNGSKVRTTTTGAGGVGGGTGMGDSGVRGTISSKPTLITTPKLRFLIMDAPRQSNLHLYIKECRRHHVTDIVRVCEPTYLGHELQQAGIALHEMAYDDGHSPPEDVLNRWLELVEERFVSNAANAVGVTTTHHSTSHSASAAAQHPPHSTTTTTKTDEAKGTIAVHCVAGLGRAPVLVAIALMEYERMDAVDAVMKIRSLRRGAINETQLRYLEGYKCRTGKRGIASGGEGGCGCWIL